MVRNGIVVNKGNQIDRIIMRHHERDIKGNGSDVKKKEVNK